MFFKKCLLMLYGVFGVGSHKVLLNRPLHSRQTHQNAILKHGDRKNKTHKK